MFISGIKVRIIQQILDKDTLYIYETNNADRFKLFKKILYK